MASIAAQYAICFDWSEFLVMVPRNDFRGVHPELSSLGALRCALACAIEAQRSERWCLALWGRFIRMRDGFRCVHCESRHGIQAHHIFRRVTFPEGKYELGNGITLCRVCHKLLHSEFNRRPH
ncbi:HNH endonuclease [Pseudomonas sp. QS1027]|uniref:HNH endonuclease n=2 Tax=unclassified Pseudomonas TaxID=196821 RepID=UPI0012FD09DC